MKNATLRNSITVRVIFYDPFPLLPSSSGLLKRPSPTTTIFDTTLNLVHLLAKTLDSAMTTILYSVAPKSRNPLCFQILWLRSSIMKIVSHPNEVPSMLYCRGSNIGDIVTKLAKERGISSIWEEL